MAEEKKNTEQQPSVLSDIVKQTTDDVLKPKALEVANSAMSDIIYAIGDWLVGIIGRKLFGMDAPVATRSRSGRTNYNRISQQPQVNTALRNSDELIEIRFENEQRAKEVIEDMRNRLSRFGKVSVGFLYEKAGKVKEQTQSDFRYGWTNPDDFGYIKNSRGIFFDASKPQPLS